MAVKGLNVYACFTIKFANVHTHDDGTYADIVFCELKGRKSLEKEILKLLSLMRVKSRVKKFNLLI